MERHEVTTAVGDFSRLSDEELLAQFKAAVMSLRAARVDGEKESLSPSAQTTVMRARGDGPFGKAELSPRIRMRTRLDRTCRWPNDALTEVASPCK